MTPKLTSSRNPVDRLSSRRKHLSIDYDFSTRGATGLRQNALNPLLRIAETCKYTLRRQFLPHYFQSPPRWRVFLRQLSDDRVLPDFGVIGTVKSGTSDVAATVLSHPNVIFPLVKEFDSPDPMEWRKYYPTIASVERHKRRTGVALSAFVGPYLNSLDTATLLSRARPNTRIIINLRNPIDLVFSEWKWAVLHSKEEATALNPFLLNFPDFIEKALEAFPAISSPTWSTLHRGIYWYSVSHWLRSLGNKNIRVLDIAEYFANRSQYLDSIANFVGLPPIVFPTDLPVANRNPVPLPAMSADSRAKLRGFFEPYNRRLWDLLGTCFAW